MAKYRVQDQGCCEYFEAADDADARRFAEGWLEGGDYDNNATLFLTATLYRLTDDGEERFGSVDVVLPPEEPKCVADAHVWCSPYELLGGMEENPGVLGHGGGVRIKEVCKHCGASRLTDTWATNPCNGTQGHETVEYSEADEETLEWVAQQQEEVSDDV